MRRKTLKDMDRMLGPARVIKAKSAGWRKIEDIKSARARDRMGRTPKKPKRIRAKRAPAKYPLPDIFVDGKRKTWGPTILDTPLKKPR